MERKGGHAPPLRYRVRGGLGGGMQREALLPPRGDRRRVIHITPEGQVQQIARLLLGRDLNPWRPKYTSDLLARGAGNLLAPAMPFEEVFQVRMVLLWRRSNKVFVVNAQGYLIVD